MFGPHGSKKRTWVYSILFTVLYAVSAHLTSDIQIAGNSFRPAIALLAVSAAVFGPVTGFFVGFFGNMGADLLEQKFWWNWCLGNGIIGLISGLLYLVPEYRPHQGVINRLHYVIFVMLSVVGNYVGLTVAGLIDVEVYQVPFQQAIYEWAITPATVNIISSATMGIILLYLYQTYKRSQWPVDDSMEGLPPQE
ncbi:ECF transporter S component [Brevibacillus dissolubilis]|uniref:ECF transporter S component n=1 Tax=Brevibacillus dissolubilis TaxID=1844116 RepID=UPI00159BEA60|nr:ECF transporter S component [Brevibacillus dissolubilis]